jgi:pyruvate kinase
MGITIPKTKIVCTIGPVSEAPEVIRGLISNGMRVARLNFSHGTRHGHEEKFVSSEKFLRIWASRLPFCKTLEGRKSAWAISLIREFGWNRDTKLF